MYYITLSCALCLNFRMYDTCCATTESASLRMFKYGRTDAIRVTTVDSLKFVQAMQDPTKKVQFCSWSVCVIFSTKEQFEPISIEAAWFKLRKHIALILTDTSIAIWLMISGNDHFTIIFTGGKKWRKHLNIYDVIFTQFYAIQTCFTLHLARAFLQFCNV